MDKILFLCTWKGFRSKCPLFTSEINCNCYGSENYTMHSRVFVNKAGSWFFWEWPWPLLISAPKWKHFEIHCITWPPKFTWVTWIQITYVIVNTGHWPKPKNQTTKVCTGMYLSTSLGLCSNPIDWAGLPYTSHVPGLPYLSAWPRGVSPRHIDVGQLSQNLNDRFRFRYMYHKFKNKPSLPWPSVFERRDKQEEQMKKKEEEEVKLRVWFRLLSIGIKYVICKFIVFPHLVTHPTPPHFSNCWNRHYISSS